MIVDCFFCITVDAKNPAPIDSSLSYYLQGFLHPGWSRISSINSVIVPNIFSKSSLLLSLSFLS